MIDTTMFESAESFNRSSSSSTNGLPGNVFHYGRCRPNRFGLMLAQSGSMSYTLGSLVLALALVVLGSSARADEGPLQPLTSILDKASMDQV